MTTKLLQTSRYKRGGEQGRSRGGGEKKRALVRNEAKTSIATFYTTLTEVLARAINPEK